MTRNYAIIETDAGLSVTEFRGNETPEVQAERKGGLLVDPGPYKTFDDAYDAMIALKEEEDEEDEAV